MGVSSSPAWHQCRSADRICLLCGRDFPPYCARHVFCSPTCGKRYRHVQAGHASQLPRYVGDCRWCGRPITAVDGRSTYHRACYPRACAAKAEQAAVEHMASLTDVAEPALSPMPLKRIRLPDGTLAEVVWDGAMVWDGTRGGLPRLNA